MKLYIINEIDNDGQQLGLGRVTIAKASPRPDDTQVECDSLNEEEVSLCLGDEDRVKYFLAEIEVVEDANAYNLALEQARSAKAKAKETLLTAFLTGCRALFQAHPQLQSFSWKQYHHCHYDRRGDFADFGSFNVTYLYPTINGSQEDEVDQAWEFDPDTGKCGQLREPTLETKLQQPVEEFLTTFDENDFLDMFGDEVMVTVFRARVPEVVTERYMGMREVRKAQKLAARNDWHLEVIPEANHCQGCYARTDAIITRPLSETEKMAAREEQLALVNYLRKVGWRGRKLIKSAVVGNEKWRVSSRRCRELIGKVPSFNSPYGPLLDDCIALLTAEVPPLFSEWFNPLRDRAYA